MTAIDENTKMSKIIKMFDQLFFFADQEIDPKDCHNGTGYFNGLALMKFEDNEIRKFTDQFGRRGIIIPNQIDFIDPYSTGPISEEEFQKDESLRKQGIDSGYRNYVFFERYSDKNMIVAQHTISHNLDLYIEHLNSFLEDVVGI